MSSGVSASWEPAIRRREARDEVAAIAARQHGIVTREQVFGAGMTAHMIAARVRSGRWTRVYPGVFSVAGSPDTWHRKVLAAVLAAGEGAVASHLTAAALHRLDGVERGRVEITIGGIMPVHLDRVVVHRSLVLEEKDRAVVDGIAVTSAARTLADCSAALSLGQLARGLDDALVRRIVRRAQLHEVSVRLGPAPGRRITKLRLLVAERGAEADTSGSPPEMRLFRILRDAGMREPVSQHPVQVGGHEYHIDAAYPDEFLALEYQGYDPHRTRSAFDSDAKRTRRLTADGWRVLYFTSKDSDADIVETIRAFGI